MELTQELTDLICELEYLIGDQCYNPNSYDGYTGDEGRSFRYPVYTYTDKSTDELVKIRGHVNGSARSIYGSVTPDLVVGHQLPVWERELLDQARDLPVSALCFKKLLHLRGTEQFHHFLFLCFIQTNNKTRTATPPTA